MKFSDVARHALGVAADLARREPVYTGVVATLVGETAVTHLGLPATAEGTAVGIVLAGAAYLVRHFVTPVNSVDDKIAAGIEGAIQRIREAGRPTLGDAFKVVSGWTAAATYAQAAQDWTKAATYAQALTDLNAVPAPSPAAVVVPAYDPPAPADEPAAPPIADPAT